MGGLGMTEIMLIFLVVLLVFGAKRIPEIARGMGKGIREFKDATQDIKRELNTDDDRQRIQSPPQYTSAPRQETYAPPREAQAPPQEEQAAQPRG